MADEQVRPVCGGCGKVEGDYSFATVMPLGEDAPPPSDVEDLETYYACSMACFSKVMRNIVETDQNGVN